MKLRFTDSKDKIAKSLIYYSINSQGLIREEVSTCLNIGEIKDLFSMYKLIENSSFLIIDTSGPILIYPKENFD